MEFWDDLDTFRVLAGKRIIGSDTFLRDPGTPVMLLSFLIGSMPVDKLFQTFYECEQAAMSSDHLGANGKPQVGLLQSMASSDRTGILFITHSKLGSPLFDVSRLTSTWGLSPRRMACREQVVCGPHAEFNSACAPRSASTFLAIFGSLSSICC